MTARLVEFELQALDGYQVFRSGRLPSMTFLGSKI
jgi:hypothetical protein